MFASIETHFYYGERVSLQLSTLSLRRARFCFKEHIITWKSAFLSWGALCHSKECVSVMRSTLALERARFCSEEHIVTLKSTLSPWRAYFCSEEHIVTSEERVVTPKSALSLWRARCHSEERVSALKGALLLWKTRFCFEGWAQGYFIQRVKFIFASPQQPSLKQLLGHRVSWESVNPSLSCITLMQLPRLMQLPFNSGIVRSVVKGVSEKSNSGMVVHFAKTCPKYPIQEWLLHFAKTSSENSNSGMVCSLPRRVRKIQFGNSMFAKTCPKNSISV